MSVQTQFIDWIIQNIPAGSNVVELGAGYYSTNELSKTFNLYSVEHQEKFLNLYDATYIYAPLVNNWYDVNILKNNLPKQYSCILVDGPPGMLNNNKKIRYGFIDNFDLFKKDIPIVLDDTNRKNWGEWDAVNYLKNNGYKEISFNNFTVCLPLK